MSASQPAETLSKNRDVVSRAAAYLAALMFYVVMAASLAAGQQSTTILSAAAPQSSPTAESTPLSKLVEEAEQNNPDVLAARLAWQAAALVPSQVATLPDPEIMVQNMSAGAPVPFWDYRSVEMTYFGVGISQEVPYPGKLRLRGEVARREAASESERAESVRRTIVELVKVTYYRLAYIQKTLDILTRDQELMEEVEKSAEAQYRAGKGNQPDVLKAQLERTKLVREVAESRQQLGSLEAQLKQLLNRPPDSPDITAATLAETPLPYGEEDLLAMVRGGNPDVKTRQQMVRSKSLGVELARKDFYPDFNVQYMWERTDAAFPDRYSLGVGIKIPIYRSRRQNPQLAQAAEELNQSRHEYQSAVQQGYFDVKDQYLAADSSAKVLTIYREGLIPQATATFQAGMAAYRVGRQDFQMLLDSFLDVLNLEKEYWRTLTEHETAIARLERLTGASLPGR